MAENSTPDVIRSTEDFRSGEARKIAAEQGIDISMIPPYFLLDEAMPTVIWREDFTRVAPKEVLTMGPQHKSLTTGQRDISISNVNTGAFAKKVFAAKAILFAEQAARIENQRGFQIPYTFAPMNGTLEAFAKQFAYSRPLRTEDASPGRMRNMHVPIHTGVTQEMLRHAREHALEYISTITRSEQRDSRRSNEREWALDLHSHDPLNLDDYVVDVTVVPPYPDIPEEPLPELCDVFTQALTSGYTLKVGKAPVAGAWVSGLHKEKSPRKRRYKRGLTTLVASTLRKAFGRTGSSQQIEKLLEDPSFIDLAITPHVGASFSVGSPGLLRDHLFVLAKRYSEGAEGDFGNSEYQHGCETLGEDDVLSNLVGGGRLNGQKVGDEIVLALSPVYLRREEDKKLHIQGKGSTFNRAYTDLVINTNRVMNGEMLRKNSLSVGSGRRGDYDHFPIFDDVPGIAERRASVRYHINDDLTTRNKSA